MIKLDDLQIKHKLILQYLYTGLAPLIILAFLYHYIDNTMHFYVLLTILAIIGFIITLRIAKKIYFPLTRATAHLDLLAEGDFSIPVSHHGTRRKDDIGNIAKAMDKINKQVGQILSRIKSMAKTHGLHIKNMEKAISQISEGAQTQSANSQELSSAIQTIAANGREASKLASNSTEFAKEAGSIMNQTIEAISIIKDRFDKISDAIGIISDISRQTNLLSINAAVEAARAGESGKGFAVVADEVNQLAKKSSVSAKEITEILEDSLHQVNNGVKMSQEAGKAVNKILDQIEDIAVQLEDISRAVQEQSNATDHSSSITESNAAASEEVASTIQEIAQETSILEGLISHFKIMK